MIGNKKLILFFGSLKKEEILCNNGSYTFIDIAINEPLTPGNILPIPIKIPLKNNMISPFNFILLIKKNYFFSNFFWTCSNTSGSPCNKGVIDEFLLNSFIIFAIKIEQSTDLYHGEFLILSSTYVKLVV